jgi:hypothetical protein
VTAPTEAEAREKFGFTLSRWLEIIRDGRSPADEQLDRIEDALIETILDSSEAELREDMKARGKDPDKCLAEVDSLIARAKTDAGV